MPFVTPLVRTLLVCLLGGGGNVHAQIVIGQSAGFSGPVAASVQELTRGAKLYFDAVNRGGGVHGERLELVSLDDKFDPKLTADNARLLVEQHRAVALFLLRGTPHTQAVLPRLAEWRVPVVAPSTGAMVLHAPVHPWVFNVRSTYQREAERAVEHLHTIGFTRIGVVHVDDSFGADVMAGAANGFEAVKLKPAFLMTFDRAKWDFVALPTKVEQARAQAVLVVGAARAVVDAVTTLRRAGSATQVVTLSNNASKGFIDLLGPHARGVVVTQVFPSARAGTSRFAREAQDLVGADGAAGALTPMMLEGIAAAKVLVAGLKRTPVPVTGDGLRRALDGLGRIDLGGFELDYSATDHTGLNFVDLSIIGRDGHFVR